MFFNINYADQAKLEVLEVLKLHEGKGGYGKRLLSRHKTQDGIKYQLHATKGWRKVGRVAA